MFVFTLNKFVDLQLSQIVDIEISGQNSVESCGSAAWSNRKPDPIRKQNTKRRYRQRETGANTKFR